MGGGLSDRDWHTETGATSGDAVGAAAGEVQSDNNVAAKNGGCIWTGSFGT